jgi:hypothetical protein
MTTRSLLERILSSSFIGQVMIRVLAILLAISCLELFVMQPINDATAQVAEYAPQVGQPHTDFILPSIEDGKPLQLSSYRGKKVLLMHFASW